MFNLFVTLEFVLVLVDICKRQFKNVKLNAYNCMFLHVLVFLVMPEAWMAPLNTYKLLWYQEHDWYFDHLFPCCRCEWLYTWFEPEQGHLQRKFSNIVWSSYRIFTCIIVCCVVTQNLWLYLKCIQNTTRHKTSSKYKVCLFQRNMFLWQQITNVHLSEQKTKFWLHRWFETYILNYNCLFYNRVSMFMV